MLADFRRRWSTLCPKNKKDQQSWQTSAFTSSPFSFHARHILPTSKFQHSYSCILLIFYRQTSGNSMHENCECECEYSSLVWRFLFGGHQWITLISPVQWGTTFFAADSFMRSSANFLTVLSERQNTNPLDAEFGPDFNAKWPFKFI